MAPSRRLGALSLFSLFAGARSACGQGNKTITTDVLVIGGGSGGTYGAIALQDQNVSVTVVERSGKLGGHADSYYGPNGAVANVGVQILYDIPAVTDYFARLNVPLATAPTTNTSTINADFSLGVAAPTAEVNLTAIGLAVQRYSEYLAANFSTVYPGYYLPDPVPEDLLMPWGDFMTKYGLDSIANLINSYIQPAEAWKEPALFPIKLLALDPIKGITSGFKVTRDVNDLYRAAATILGDSVLYNSSVVSILRSDASGVVASVQTPTGLVTINAKKLLMAAPPVASNLAGWDQTSEEQAVFAKFKGQQYYAGVIRHPGIPASTLQNVGFTTPFNIPELPALFNVVPTGFGDNTSVVYYTARERVEPDAAKADTVATLQRLAAGGVIGEGDAEFLAWFDHPNVRMYVEAEDIRDGFYKRLYALQGQSNTYWTGAAWVTQASSPIWDYTKSLVSEIISNGI